MTICAVCDKEFTPKAMGFNAKYCGKSCKAKAGYARTKAANPEKLSAWRKKSYSKEKQSVEKMEKRRRGGRSVAQKTRKWLADYKMQSGCVDCGFKGHFAALQLDHEGTKSVHISEARSSVARLKKEIADGECKVRCANCHSIKTWERKHANLRDNEAPPK